MRLSSENHEKIKAALSNLNEGDIPLLKKEMVVYEGGSCAECGNTGYKGRIGVFEGFLMTERMEKLTLTNPPLSDIEKLATEEGMVTMLQDGYMKALKGITSLSEIERVLG